MPTAPWPGPYHLPKPEPSKRKGRGYRDECKVSTPAGVLSLSLSLSLSLPLPQIPAPAQAALCSLLLWKAEAEGILTTGRRPEQAVGWGDADLWPSLLPVVSERRLRIGGGKASTSRDF